MGEINGVVIVLFFWSNVLVEGEFWIFLIDVLEGSEFWVSLFDNIFVNDLLWVFDESIWDGFLLVKILLVFFEKVDLFWDLRICERFEIVGLVFFFFEF